jgi:hypothetical protein
MYFGQELTPMQVSMASLKATVHLSNEIQAEFIILNPYYEITRIPPVMLHHVLFCMQ